MMPKLLAVDPGLHSAGWAVFSHADLKQIPPIRVGIVKGLSSMRDADVLRRANYIGEQMALIAQENSCLEAVIEFPMHFGGSGGDAASRAGDIIKLATCVGAIAGNLHQIGVQPLSVRVIDWKGQLPKEVVIKRITRLLGPVVCQRLGLDKDSWDACGIGLNHRGVRL